MLWRIVVMTSSGYLEGYYSLFDHSNFISFVAHDSDPSLLDPLKGDWAVERLQWFTHGFYRVNQSPDGITITDLRMGFEPFYIFSFRVAQPNGDHIEPVEPQRVTSPPLPPGAFAWIWHRIWEASPHQPISPTSSSEPAKIRLAKRYRSVHDSSPPRAVASPL